MESTAVKLTVPSNVAYCRGRVCSHMTTCSRNEACSYRSSADEYRSNMEGSVTTIGNPEVSVASVPLLEENKTQLEMFDAGVVAPVVRVFATGANRDVDTDKLDYEGFLSPAVLKRFAEYMHKNRKLRDGSLRDSDNWQKGIPIKVYMKSMWRHFMAVWTGHRFETDVEEDLCAMLFNVQGYLHEILKAK